MTLTFVLVRRVAAERQNAQDCQHDLDLFHNVDRQLKDMKHELTCMTLTLVSVRGATVEGHEAQARDVPVRRPRTARSWRRALSQNGQETGHRHVY